MLVRGFASLPRDVAALAAASGEALRIGVGPWDDDGSGCSTRSTEVLAMRVTLFDYGAGNLHSLAKALEAAGRGRCASRPTRRARSDTDVLVLPGVGAFGAAAERLAPGRDAMREAIRGGLPAIGICLGMQLLFDESDEGAGAGLGVIPGRVTRLEARARAADRLERAWSDAARSAVRRRAARHRATTRNSFVCRPGSIAAS